jgi:hypothetical protein
MQISSSVLVPAAHVGRAILRRALRSARCSGRACGVANAACRADIRARDQQQRHVQHSRSDVRRSAARRTVAADVSALIKRPRSAGYATCYAHLLPLHTLGAAMASVAAVGDILGRLHASKSPEYAKVLIERDLAPEVEQLPAEHVLALLLDPGVGLLSFVAATGGGEEAPRSAALKLLKLTVQRAAPADVARYAAAVRDACAALATADGDNKVKEEALELLAATLAQTTATQPLRQGELAASLRVWLFRNATPAKAPGGVRAWALRCLGALAEHHAAAVAAHEAAAPPLQVPYGDVALPVFLRDRCLRDIQEQLAKVASKKDESKVLTGALDALCAALAAVPPGALQAEQARQALRACLSCLKLVVRACLMDVAALLRVLTQAPYS